MIIAMQNTTKEQVGYEDKKYHANFFVSGKLRTTGKSFRSKTKALEYAERITLRYGPLKVFHDRLEKEKMSEKGREALDKVMKGIESER